jgi:zinc protease
MRLISVLVIAAALLSMDRASRAFAQPGPEVRVSDNVFVIPDPKATDVTGWMIVAAGCADEDGGQCRGIAHYLEHLLLIGRGPAHNAGSIAVVPGGSGNAWTTHRSTTFFQKFPSKGSADNENLAAMVKYFGRTLDRLAVDSAAANRERDVVLQEFNRANAVARFAMAMNEKVLPGEALGQRVIGTTQTITDFTIDAAQTFHRRHYKSSNAILVVHGPITAANVNDLVSIHLRNEEPTAATAAPAESKIYASSFERFDKTDKQTQIQTVNIDRIAHHGNANNARMNAARTLVALYLSSQLPGSPTDKFLKQDGLIALGGFNLTRVRSGVLRLSVSLNPATGVTPEQLNETFLRYLTDLAATGITPVLIARLKQRMIDAGELQSSEPDKHAAALAGWFQGRNSYEAFLMRLEALNAVTQDDVQTILRALAGPARHVLGVLSPG